MSNIETITAKYEVFTDFNVVDIIKEYNSNNKTNYSNKDIKDYYIKYNTLQLNMKDGQIIIESQDIEYDFKRPAEYIINDKYAK